VRLIEGNRLYSASDLVNFLGCTHATVLDVKNLAAPVSFPPDDEAAQLLQEKGIEHEKAFLERLKASGKSAVEIPTGLPLHEQIALTREALKAGPDVIYQGAFSDGTWHGYSDFLLRVQTTSLLGAYSYEVADTKLSRSARPKHLIQMGVYSDILAEEQGAEPRYMHVVLGDGSIASVEISSIIHYFRRARERFLAFAEAPLGQSSGAPCGHCHFCRWAGHCEAEWEAAHDLTLVAGMTRGQAQALRHAGIPDLIALGASPPGFRVPGIQTETLARLVSQARLQAGYRNTGERAVELLNAPEGRGLGRLPLPDQGDMFFDMEGDPLFEGGLEYLFGIVTMDGSDERFHAFWAHDREEEKEAFQATIDFITDRLRSFPGAHIYHYASYEETALKRLAMLHGTRETEVDDFLRHHKLVDLYRVVKESVRTSEPSYSIKNIEKFYLGEERGGDVTTASDSIVIYERWRRLKDDKLLADIANYNELDCRSTRLCRDWLAGMRDPRRPWYRYELPTDLAKKAEDRTAAEAEVAAMAETLLAGEEGQQPWRQLLVDLLEFHQRESKPAWWAIFSRQYLPHEELLEDAECLAGLDLCPEYPPRPEKKSMIHTFTFPAQDFKLKAGDNPTRAISLESAGEIIAIDEDALRIELKIGPSRSPIEPGTALIPAEPFRAKAQRDAIRRLAEAIRDGEGGRYSAVLSILRRDLPSLIGREGGAAILPDEVAELPAIIGALKNLDHSHMLIQGPPGAGKTYTSARAIVALLEAGKRVGVASHGHKAINQLLKEIEKVTAGKGGQFRGIKKSSREDQKFAGGGWIEDTTANQGVTTSHQLVAGTAFLFARPEHDQQFDYLFVDEAGQVSLADVVAMGTAARNVVLVGDQMQLAQPIKGAHPRGSGISGLQYILKDHPTVPPERGIFLSQTRRMHPDLCAFISAAVYDGRLHSAAGAEVRQVLADPSLDPEAIGPSGLRFVDVESLACTQRNTAEAERLNRTYRALLGQPRRNKASEIRKITTEDILVVSPYNMQVEILKRTLPAGARVGTVDKFQGQEAAIVLISMATSSGEDLPRNIEFLYSRNRLNVAISRAECLAVIFANPRLLEVACHTIPQMELVNGLCWAREFANHQVGRTR
jgi:uncharacterized protein